MNPTPVTEPPTVNPSIPAIGHAYTALNKKTNENINVIYEGKERHGHIVGIGGKSYWARRTSGPDELPMFEFNPDMDLIH